MQLLEIRDNLFGYGQVSKSRSCCTESFQSCDHAVIGSALRPQRPPPVAVEDRGQRRPSHVLQYESSAVCIWKLWIKPEGKELCIAFSKLRKLCLLDVYVEFDLLWMTALLEAAPFVEILDIEIYEHPCTMDTELKCKIFGERTNPSWNVSEFRSCEAWLLKQIRVIGFSPLKQQITFIRAVMQRAPNLQTVVLKDHRPCQGCEKKGVLPRSERLPAEYVFPKGKDEQDTVVKQLYWRHYPFTCPDRFRGSTSLEHI
ncbi:hypothetical protein ACP4OV_028365 [Aristida adscensionis]